MRTFILSISMMMLGAALYTANAQTEEQREEVQEKILELRLEKDDIEIQEKEALKREVEAINKMLEEGKISSAEAEELKEEAAQKRAKNIENRTAIVNNQIALLERNGQLGFADTTKTAKRFSLSISNNGESFIDYEKKEKKERYDERTYSHLVVAAGFNNALADGQSLSDSDYKLAGSRFFEIGWAWRTRVFKNSNFMRVKYGVSFQFNGLKPTDNRVFVEQEDGQVELVEFPINLDKSKFRMDNLVVPIHFEFGPSSKNESDTSIRYSTANKFKVGVGGYAGFNIGSVQKLKYEEDGRDIKQKFRGAYDTEEFIYGLSAYVGWGDTSLYAKYDLNPIFKNNLVEERNVSLGLRFDL